MAHAKPSVMSENNHSRLKRVFISATTHDLRSYRELVTKWARDRHYDPVVQDEFPTHSDLVTVRSLLRDKLSPCDAVVHLAGLYYGAEPEGAVASESRRSYTQLEYDVARALRKQVIVLIADDQYEPDHPIEEQNPELAKLQSDHRNRILANKGMYYYFKDQSSLLAKLEKVVITDSIAKPSNLPAVGTLFKGRDEFLEQLRAKVERKIGSALVITTKQTIHGLGGIGKTRLAIEYANRYAEYYNALLFVVADSPESLRANIANLCGALRIDEADPAKQCDAAIRWLQEHPGWFLIVDNVDTKEAASAVEESILCKLKEGHILVTSRLSGWRNRDLEPLELDVISEKASVEMLMEGTEGSRRAKEDDRDAAEKLSKKFGFLPLALQQAVGFISTRRCAIRDYLERWEKADKKVVEWHDELELKYPRSLATTWELSFHEISDNSRAALSVISWLAPDPIPRSLLEKTSQSSEPLDIEDAVAELSRYSFLQVVDADCQLVQVHSLVSQITRYRMSNLDRKMSLQRALSAAVTLVEGSPPQDPSTWPTLYSPCREHFTRLIEQSGELEASTDVASLMNHLGLYLAKLASFSQAELLYRRALKIYEGLLGPNHADVAVCMNNLAALLVDIHRYADAEQLYQKALKIREEIYGPNHPNVGLSLNNLATLWDSTGRQSLAEPFYRRALEIYKSNVGSYNHRIALIKNNLAVSLANRNRWDEAESMYREALKMREELYGSNHPEVASSIHDLAHLLEHKGQYEEVESMYLRALNIREEVYGPNHPDVAQSLHDLATLHRKRGRTEEAESLFKRALEIRERLFGVKHPSIASSLLGLAGLLDDMDSKIESEALYRRVLEIRTASLGAKHPDVARSLMQLGILSRSNGRHAESEDYYRRAMNILDDKSETAVADLAICQLGLAVLLQEKGELSEAEDLLQRAITNWKNSYGPEDVTLAKFVNHLALLFQKTNRFDEAEMLHNQALQILQNFYGSDHLDVAACLCNLAMLYVVTDRINEAESFHRDALVIREKHLGRQDLDVAFSLKEYAGVLRLLNRFDEAEPMIRRAMHIYENSKEASEPRLAECLHELSAIIRMHSPEQAEVYSRQALRIFDSQTPIDLISCACVRSVLTRVLCSLHRLKEAVAQITEAVEFLHRKRMESGISQSVERVIIQNYRETLQLSGLSDDEIEQRLTEFAPEFRNLME